jgi:hypothetical protein
MTTSWYDAVKLHEIKPDLPLNLIAFRRLVATWSAIHNLRQTWTKWECGKCICNCEVSKVAKRELHSSRFTARNGSSVRHTIIRLLSRQRWRARPDFQPPIHAVMAWRQDGGETLPLLVQFHKLRSWLRVYCQESVQRNSILHRTQESWTVLPSLQFRPSWASLPVHLLVSFILFAAPLSP